MVHRWSAGFVAVCLLICQHQMHAQTAAKGKNAPARNSNASTTTDAQIDKTIRAAEAYLLGRLASLEEGYSAVTAMALLKGGRKPEEPVIRAALDKILARIIDGKFVPLNKHLHIYEAGTGIMALGSADSKKYKPEIEAISNYIISQQCTDGQWYYDTGNFVNNGDTSVTQYAILGLWEASRAGITIPGKVWDRVAAWQIMTQMPDGGFCYHPKNTEMGQPQFGQSSHNMSMAGICNLQICRLHLYPNARDLEAEMQKKRLRGVKWEVLEPLQIEDEDPEAAGGKLTRQDTYTPTVRLAAMDNSIKTATRWLTQRYTTSPPGTWMLYYLYTLERMATLTGLEEIAGHDWYGDGTAYLVSMQGANGSWADWGGYDSGTALGSLFLGRATMKMLKHKPRPRFGTGILKGGRDLPENLDNLSADKGDLKVKKMTGSIDTMLVELEKLDSINLESAAAALEDLSILKDTTALLKQRDRLMKLANDPRPNARATAFSVLGKTDDIRVAPILIDAVAYDKDPDCVLTAHKSLKFLSRLVRLGESLEFTEDQTPDRREKIVAFWRNWYRVSRPYVERDGLPASPPQPAASVKAGP